MWVYISSREAIAAHSLLPCKTRFIWDPSSVFPLMISGLPLRWISVLQNSKEEALNNAFKGDQHVGENNIVQELTKAILGEVKRMAGNDVCCDCGAPGKWPGNWQEVVGCFKSARRKNNVEDDRKGSRLEWLNLHCQTTSQKDVGTMMTSRICLTWFYYYQEFSRTYSVSCFFKGNRIKMIFSACKTNFCLNWIQQTYN